MQRSRGYASFCVVMVACGGSATGIPLAAEQPSHLGDPASNGGTLGAPAPVVVPDAGGDVTSGADATQVACPVDTFQCGSSRWCTPVGEVCCASVGRPDLYCSPGTSCTVDGRCLVQSTVVVPDASVAVADSGSTSINVVHDVTLECRGVVSWEDGGTFDYVVGDGLACVTLLGGVAACVGCPAFDAGNDNPQCTVVVSGTQTPDGLYWSVGYDPVNGSTYVYDYLSDASAAWTETAKAETPACSPGAVSTSCVACDNTTVDDFCPTGSTGNVCPCSCFVGTNPLAVQHCGPTGCVCTTPSATTTGAQSCIVTR